MSFVFTTAVIRANLIRWIEALRSNKYTQARRVLRTPGDTPCFCCLGVACDLHDPSKWILNPTTRQMDLLGKDTIACTSYARDHYPRDATHAYTCVMPFELRPAYGLTDTDTADLMELNDEQEATFAEIADFIETNILPRFPEPEGPLCQPSETSSTPSSGH
jgi:hypothetical protein